MLITIYDRCAWFLAGLMIFAAYGRVDLDDRAIELAKTTPLGRA